MNSIEHNINRAISVSNEFSDKPAIDALQQAKRYMKQAISARDAGERATALANAKQALIAVNNQMAERGYGKAIPSVSSPNKRRVL